MTAQWEETILPILLTRHQLKDIFNADEFGLFYEALPLKFLHFRGKHCSGGKHRKARLTVMAASNALDEQIPMFVIGKSANPRCFKHIRKLPCRYRSYKKASVDGTLFEDLLPELDPKFEIHGRKIVMTVGNCPAHTEVSGLNSIKLQFLPTRTTSCIQPKYQDVIRYILILLYPNRQGVLPSIHVELKSPNWLK